MLWQKSRREFLGTAVSAVAGLVWPSVLYAANTRKTTAFDLLDPPLSYGADYKLVTDKGRYLGNVVHAPGRERREWATKTGRQILIVRRDSDAIFILLPMLKSYLSHKLSVFSGLIGNPNALRIEMIEDGRENLSGITTTRYRAQGAEPKGGRFAGKLWLSKSGLMVKADGLTSFDGQETAIEYALSNPDFGTVDPELFEPPEGYGEIKLADHISPEQISALIKLMQGK